MSPCFDHRSPDLIAFEHSPGSIGPPLNDTHSVPGRVLPCLRRGIVRREVRAKSHHRAISPSCAGEGGDSPKNGLTRLGTYKIEAKLCRRRTQPLDAFRHPSPHASAGDANALTNGRRQTPPARTRICCRILHLLAMVRARMCQQFDADCVGNVFLTYFLTITAFGT
jgi:hypothetical protein